MKNGHYEGSDIKVLADEERKNIDQEKLKIAAEKHQAGFGEGEKKNERESSL